MGIHLKFMGPCDPMGSRKTVSWCDATDEEQQPADSTEHNLNA